MAQETRLLLDSLLKASNVSTSRTNIKENLLQLLSDDSTGRTNQFEVQARLNGLVEKCWILNNGALGEALQQRLEELPKISNQWTPDVLSFLLTLSDRPVHNTRVEDLASLVPSPPTPPLTWNAIIEEDPLEDQTAVWRDIDFAAESSDEGGDLVSQLSEFEDDERFNVSKSEIIETDVESLIVAVDSSVLEDVTLAQTWRKDAAKTTEQRSANDEDVLEILEINIIREVIFMLLGLPTSIFEVDDEGEYRLQPQLKLLHTSSQSVGHLLDSFLSLGHKLSTIREWTRREFDVPLEQAFQSALESRLQVFHSTLAGIQKKLIDQTRSVVVSIVGVCNEILISSRLPIQLYDILSRVKAVSDSQRPFKILEALHSQTYINQKIGDDEGYEYVARIFFQCFQIYLKPIQDWMETGKADSHNPIMFVEKAVEDVSSHLLWQDQYRLIQNADGELKAPQFLNVAGRKIFTTGKSVYFLKKLGIENPKQNSQPHSESLITYEDVCSTVDPRKLVPFPELFDTAFARWIASKQRSSSILLRQQLELECGLEKTLTALDHIYLYYNGARSNNAVRPLFEKIERGNQRWNDSFFTTGLFHDVFATIDCIDIDRLSIRPGDSKHALNVKERSMDVLEKLQVSYTLPWPIANIIKPQSMTTYQRIFIFLTQLERARFLLQRNKLSLSASKNLYSVRTHLLWFVNVLLAHLTTLVIAVNTKALHDDLSNAEDVDAMIVVHQAYIAKLEDHCFLAQKDVPLRRAVVSILDLTVLFADLQVPFALQNQQLGLSGSYASDDEDEDENDASPRADKPANDIIYQLSERLRSIHDTYKQLLAIVTASVEGKRKADGGLNWTTLASHLAFGAVT